LSSLISSTLLKRLQRVLLHARVGFAAKSDATYSGARALSNKIGATLMLLGAITILLVRGSSSASSSVLFALAVSAVTVYRQPKNFWDSVSRLDRIFARPNVHRSMKRLEWDLRVEASGGDCGAAHCGYHLSTGGFH